MNIQPTEYKKKKYTVKPANISHAEAGTSQYNLTKEEVAESVIRSLDGAIKDMKNGTHDERKNDFNEKLERWLKIAEEMGKNEN